MDGGACGGEAFGDDVDEFDGVGECGCCVVRDLKGGGSWDI